MTELVEHEERGLLVPPGDVDGLAAAMEWMMAHPEKAREMGRRAREYAGDQHGAEAHYGKLMQVYGWVMRRDDAWGSSPADMISHAKTQRRKV